MIHTDRRTLLAFIALFLTFMACSKRPSAPAERDSQRADSQVVSLALIPTAACLPLYYAVDAGLFLRKGLHVKIITTEAQSDCDTALSGNADGGFVDATRLQRFTTGNPTLRPVLRLSEQWGAVAAPTLRLKTPSDLQNRVVAVAHQTVAERVLQNVLQAGQLRQDDAMFPQIGNFRVATDMVSATQVDAAILPEPYLSAATRLNCKELFRTSSDTDGYLLLRPKRMYPQNIHVSLAQVYNQAVDSLNQYGTQLTTPLLQRYCKLSHHAADTLRLPKFAYAVQYGQ